MDIARTATTRACRFFFDNGTEATINWYRAPVGAKVFPGVHKWNHLAWYARPWEATGVGEVYGSKEKYSKGFTPPTATGQAFFGSLEDMQNGASFNPLSFTPRDTWGLALACHGIADNFILLEPDYNPVLLAENGDFIVLES